MKSLNDGPSKIVPIRMTDTEKTEAVAACKNGESLSSFVRDAIKARVKKWKQRKAKRVNK